MLAAFALLAGGCKHAPVKPQRNSMGSMLQSFPESPEEREFNKL